MRSLAAILTIALLAVSGLPASADGVSTDIVVRAKARDAKFIGSSIGGALIRIRDVDTGKVLAEGMTEGGTGDTDLIMKTPRERYGTIGKGAAAFRAKLDLVRPVFAEIEVIAPYIKKQARVVSSTQIWLIPGKPINGDGIIVEVPGMIVDILSPGTHLSAPAKKGPFEIKANIVMMCGCPLTKGGIWNGNEIEVAAIIEKDGAYDRTIGLPMQDTINTFAAAFEPKLPGNYHVTVYAYDPKTGNTGVDQTAFIVTN
jgi:hypothetical protein